MSKLHGSEVGKKIADSATYIKDKGVGYAGVAVSVGKDTAVYAGKKGYEIGKAAYTKVKDNEKVMSIGGAVYKTAKSAIGAVGGLIASKAGEATKDGELPGTDDGLAAKPDVAKTDVNKEDKKDGKEETKEDKH